ncbi:MAG TPA: PilZ domain-containing protein [Nitrospira sp.]|nr:PilZ domain-containing protein [Nitrospira sp.]
MKDLHCPHCGTPFVRVIHDEGAIGRVLTRFKFFAFRCQLCTTRFRVFRSQVPAVTSPSDRRQYERLPVSLRANLLSESQVRMNNRVTDISMGGCTLETTTNLPQGTFIELVIKPASDEEPIKIETAMVCSSRPESMGIRFMEMVTDDKNRLSQVILSLLVGQSLHQNLFL